MEEAAGKAVGDRPEAPEVKRLFIWSAGGLSGADMAVGVWLALEEAGIVAHANAGTSAGAILAAFNSAGFPATQAEEAIRNLTDDDIRQERRLWKLRMPWLDSFLLHAPLRQVLGEYLPDTFSALVKPLTVAVTDGDDQPLEITQGELLRAILASMSIAGVWPAVDLDGHPECSDGGTTAYVPVPANFAAYQEIVVILTRQNLRFEGGNILSRLIHNVHILQEDQINDTLALLTGMHPNVTVLHPPLRTSKGMLRFDHDLIGEAYIWAKSVLRQRQARREAREGSEGGSK